MHLPDGILAGGVCAAGYAVAGVAAAASLATIRRRTDPHKVVPKASILTAVFFVASWIHVPVPPASVHLVLNGLLGVVLGPFAFLAILVGLFFQAVLFQHGGLTTLGVNAMVIGLPALLVGAVFGLASKLWRRSRGWAAALGFVAGSLAIVLSALAFSVVVVTLVPAELDASLQRTGAAALTVAHLPLALLEGVFTAMVVLFLRRVQPDLLAGWQR
jgi:cobalt/nickel transport system permease protein